MHISRSSIDRCEYSTQHNNSHSSFSQSMNEKWARMQSSRVEIEQNLNKHNSIEDSELPTHFPASLNNCCCVCRNYRQLFALDGEWNGNKMFSLTINRHIVEDSAAGKNLKSPRVLLTHQITYLLSESMCDAQNEVHQVSKATNLISSFTRDIDTFWTKCQTS